MGRRRGFSRPSVRRRRRGCGAGEVVVERVQERVAAPEMPGAMLHHWRGTAFVPGGSGGGVRAAAAGLQWISAACLRRRCCAREVPRLTSADRVAGIDAGAAEACDDGGDGFELRREVWAAGCAAWMQRLAEHAGGGDRGGGDGGRARAGSRARSMDFCGG